jgi:hypothetical protein
MTLLVAASIKVRLTSVILSYPASLLLALINNCPNVRNVVVSGMPAFRRIRALAVMCIDLATTAMRHFRRFPRRYFDPESGRLAR